MRAPFGFLFDSKLKMPITKVNTSQFNALRLHEYNTLILASGNYTSLGESGATKIKNVDATRRYAYSGEECRELGD
jgi:hypothetical protein